MKNGLVLLLVVQVMTRCVYAMWGKDDAVLYPTNADSDLFGNVVTMSGDKMAVGLYSDHTIAINAGVVYTYTWSGSAWVADAAVLYPTNPAADHDHFGMAVSMSGDKMAVGAIYDDTVGNDAGAVYTYTWSGGAGAWMADAAILYPTNPTTAFGYFGEGISMSGDKMAVWARGDDTEGSNAGAVYTYTWSGAGGWVADAAVLTPSNPVATGDAFGGSLSMSGDKMAVGVPGDETEGSNAGAVYTYTWSGSAWVADAVVLTPSNPVATGDAFGSAVSMSGDKLAVGVHYDDTVDTDAGTVYTYTWSGSAWVVDAAGLYPTNHVSVGDGFGYSVSMSGDKLAVGAYDDNTVGDGSGAVYTYTWSGSAWVADAAVLYPSNPIITYDNFGIKVSMSGGKMAVGAQYDDTAGDDAGAVYTFSTVAPNTNTNTTPSLNMMIVISILVVPPAILMVGFGMCQMYGRTFP